MAEQAWMKRRKNESKAAWQARLNRTCYACGTEFYSMKQCDEHEEKNHNKPGPRN